MIQLPGGSPAGITKLYTTQSNKVYTFQPEGSTVATTIEITTTIEIIISIVVESAFQTKHHIATTIEITTTIEIISIVVENAFQT